jgi:hypothetical protein
VTGSLPPVTVSRATPEVGAVRRTTWGLRRWWWVALVPIVAGVVAAVLAATEEPDPEVRFEATALVVAQELTIQAEELPRLAQAVFDGGAVARSVSAGLDGAVDAADLVPARIDAEPVVGTIAIRVVGRGSSAGEAADVANLAADAFVDELNAAGDGVGLFGVQAPAAPPDGPVGSAASIAGLLLLLGCGVVGGVALVGFVVAVRQPVLSGAEAAAAAGARLAGSVRITPGSDVAASAMPGLDALARRLIVAPSAIALVGTGADGGATAHLARALAERVGERMPAELLFPTAAPSSDRRTGDGATIAVVSDPSVDVPQLLASAERVYLVVAEGTPQRHVVRATEPFGPGELTGTVYLRRRTVERRGADGVVPDDGDRQLVLGQASPPSAASDPSAETDVALLVRGEASAYLSVGGAAFSFFGRGGVASAPLASVVVDDQGRAPVVRLRPGRYELVQTAVAEGYEPAAPTLVDVGRRDRDEPMVVEVHNQAERGRLIVRCQGPSPTGPVSLHYDFDNDGRYVCIVDSVRLRSGIAAVDRLLPGAFRVVADDLVVDVEVQAGASTTATLLVPGGGPTSQDVDDAVPEA